MKRTTHSSLATPSPDTVAPKKTAAWAKPGQQAKHRTADASPATIGVLPLGLAHDSLTAEQELMQAMQEYKESSGRMFPTWSEVLEVVQGLGYQKLCLIGLGQRHPADKER